MALLRHGPLLFGVLAATLVLGLSAGFLVCALLFSESSWAYKQEDPCGRGDGPHLEDGLGRSFGVGVAGGLIAGALILRGRPFADARRTDPIALWLCGAAIVVGIVSLVLMLTIPPCVII